jgi:hypothetical protein
MLDRSEVGATHAARFISVSVNWILQGRLFKHRDFNPIGAVSAASDVVVAAAEILRSRKEFCPACRVTSLVEYKETGLAAVMTRSTNSATAAR